MNNQKKGNLIIKARFVSLKRTTDLQTFIDVYWEMMMMNCFIRMVDQWKPFSLISSRSHSQRFCPSQISNKLQAGFKSVKNLGSDFAELSCATLCWIELYSSNNHYTTASLKNIYGYLSLSLSLSPSIFKDLINIRI